MNLRIRIATLYHLFAFAFALTLALAPLPAAFSADALLAPDADNGAITLPPGFRAIAVADDVGSMRFLALRNNGDIYVKLRTGGIVALRDTDGDGRADVRETFATDEGGGTGIVVRDGWLYHSTNSEIFRYRLPADALVPDGSPEKIVTGLPDRRQHNAKSIAFDPQGRLYVEVGSPSNALGVPDRGRGASGSSDAEIAAFQENHGGVWRFDANRAGQTQADGFHVSTGHRHILALAWNPARGAMFVVMHGRDQLHTVAPDHYSAQQNAELPAEEMHILTESADLGWPRTYYDPRLKLRMVGPEYGGDGKTAAAAGKHPDPLVAFPAHWAPMQMAFYNSSQFPAKYRGGAFVAFHGSWNRAPEPQRGYNVTYVPVDERGMPRGDFEVFADGFAGVSEIGNPRDARFRPCGLAVGPDGSLYVAASQGGRIWRIFHTGE